MSDCLFCKIARGDIPAEKVHEDGEIFAIKDINPQAPLHLLLIPHRHMETILDPGLSAVAGHIFDAAAGLARKHGHAEQGFRVVANCNRDAGQTVFHVHFHLLAGRRFAWPPG
jgi:diadenosine tetraphosphate (Ap4A) HIT family hydrolase